MMTKQSYGNLYLRHNEQVIHNWKLNQEHTMFWTELRFGKHRGKTLPQVIFSDPDWFFWAMEKRIFEDKQLQNEAQDIAKKATNIRIPQKGSKKLVVKYILSYNGRFSDFILVPEDETELMLDESTRSYKLEKIDFSFPREVKGYDKLGYAKFIRVLKFHFFGKSNYQMTKKRCEEFFENEEIFL